jgi:hypothetical protein
MTKTNDMKDVKQTFKCFIELVDNDKTYEFEVEADNCSHYWHKYGLISGKCREVLGRGCGQKTHNFEVLFILFYHKFWDNNTVLPLNRYWISSPISSSQPIRFQTIAAFV